LVRSVRDQTSERCGDHLVKLPVSRRFISDVPELVDDPYVEPPGWALSHGWWDGAGRGSCFTWNKGFKACTLLVALDDRPLAVGAMPRHRRRHSPGAGLGRCGGSGRWEPSSVREASPWSRSRVGAGLRGWCRAPEADGHAVFCGTVEVFEILRRSGGHWPLCAGGDIETRARWARGEWSRRDAVSTRQSSPSYVSRETAGGRNWAPTSVVARRLRSVRWLCGFRRASGGAEGSRRPWRCGYVIQPVLRQSERRSASEDSTWSCLQMRLPRQPSGHRRLSIWDECRSRTRWTISATQTPRHRARDECDETLRYRCVHLAVQGLSEW